MTDLTAHHRLATYGTLAPGRVNHHQLDGLEGQWLQGHVRGTLVASGWGADLVVEADLGLYDYCALVPVVEGAGGVISTWTGEPMAEGPSA